jgi:hypothetical protein
MPMMPVMTNPPGSRPGIRNLTTIPAVSPKTIHPDHTHESSSFGGASRSRGLVQALQAPYRAGAPQNGWGARCRPARACDAHLALISQCRATPRTGRRAVVESSTGPSVARVAIGG